MQEQGRERNKCEAVLICRSFDVECVANAIDVFVSLSIRLSGTAVFIENVYSCLICHKSELFKFNFVILDIVDIAPLCCCVVADFIIELESTYRFFVLNRPKLLEKNAMAAKSCIL